MFLNDERTAEVRGFMLAHVFQIQRDEIEAIPEHFMCFLLSKHFQEEDFAATIRKKQSASWALKWSLNIS